MSAAPGTGTVNTRPRTTTVFFGGVYGQEAVTIGPIRVEDLLPFDDHANLPVEERFVKVVEQLWEQTDFVDVLKAFASLDESYRDTMVAIAMDPVARDAFVTHAMDGYARYIADSAKGTLDFVVAAFKLLAEISGWQRTFEELTVEALIAAVDPSRDVDFNTLMAEAHERHPELLMFVVALAQIADLFKVVRANKKLVFNAALDLYLEILVALLEVIRDGKIRELLDKFVKDPAALGTFVGRVTGFVVWDICVDEVTTLGFGKAAKGVRWLAR